MISLIAKLGYPRIFVYSADVASPTNNAFQINILRKAAFPVSNNRKHSAISQFNLQLVTHCFRLVGCRQDPNGWRRMECDIRIQLF